MAKIKEYETHIEMYLDLPKGGVGAEIGVCKGFNATFCGTYLNLQNFIYVMFGRKEAQVLI